MSSKHYNQTGGDDLDMLRRATDAFCEEFGCRIPECKIQRALEKTLLRKLEWNCHY